MSKKKILVIVGQTATGKSKLAVRLAKKFNGEIISADSRQVYKGLNLGTGKISKEEMQGVPHHLLDVANPKKQFSVAKYQKLSNSVIAKIFNKNKIPILVGGTGFYIDAVTKGMILPEVPPNPTLRKKLALKSNRYLMLMLQKLDPERAKNIDPKNKVRLIRAIEIAKHLGKVPSITAVKPLYEFVKIGLMVPEKTLKRKIRIRLQKRLRAGMAIEIYELQKRGVPWKRFIELGFDQKYTAMYLRGEINEREMLEKLFKENWQYAKRQMTWFKRDKDIKWFSYKVYPEIEKFVKEKLV